MMIQKQFVTENGNIVYWINSCSNQECALVFLHGLTADHTLFGLSYYSNSDKWWLRQIEWMAHCYPHKALVKAIAKSCTCTKYKYINIKNQDLFLSKIICQLS